MYAILGIDKISEESMGFRELTYFLAVVREGSILRASEALYLTQPNLSRQMHRLEEEFGQELLIRGTRRITLTRAGELFKSRAEELIALRDRLYEEMKQNFEYEASEKVEGRVLICGEEGGITSLLGDVVREMQGENSDIEYNFSCATDTEIADKLEKGIVHFGLISEPFDTSRCEHITLFRNAAWGMLVKKDSEYAEKDCITPEDFCKMTIICPTKSSMKDMLQNWTSKPYEELNISATYDSMYNAITLVDAGVGNAICLQNCADNVCDSTLCFVPLSEGLNTDIKLVWLRYKIMPESCLTFLKHLRAIFPSEDGNDNA